jgi:hypothetical protein
MGKNKYFLFLIFLILLNCNQSKENQNSIVQGSEEDILQINKKDFIKGYTNKYEFYTLETVKDEKVIKVFNKYFKDQKYIIIFIGDMNADGDDDYFAVIEYPGIYKGIKEGLISDNKGNIEMYFDTEIGIYKNKKEIYYDLKRIGFKKGEISCIRLLVSEEDFIYTPDDLKKEVEKYGQSKNLHVNVGGWYFQFLDRDLKVISDSSNQIFAQYDSQFISRYAIPAKKEVYFQQLIPFSEEETYEDLQYALEEYRENKKKGLVFDPINYIP